MGAAGTGRVQQRRLRVHVMPLESEALGALLDELHARAAARGGAVLGMDAEWQPELQRHEHNPVALLQLAWEDDVFLVRLQHLNGAVPPALHRLLGDEGIVKVGCAVGSDVKRLHLDYGVETASHLDLRDVLGGLGLLHLRKRNLAFLAREFLGYEMDKAQQCSDWANRELSPEQIAYSAVDAWAAYGIVDTLFRRYRDQVGTPQPPCVTTFCRRLFPRGSKKPPASASASSGGSSRRKSRLPAATAAAAGGEGAVAAEAGGGGGGGGHQNMTATAALLQTRGGATTTTPTTTATARQVGGHLSRTAAGAMYDNGRMLAPDGELLCTLSRKKARWYLDRGLATLDGGSLEPNDAAEPPVIRLLFEPSGRRLPVGEEDAACERVDQCVACGAGAGAGLVKHHVVPVALRRCFPPLYKEHMSHDVLALCLDCHLRLNAHLQRRMEACEARYAPPTPPPAAAHRHHHGQAVLRDRRLETVRRAGAALLRHGDGLPAARRAELEAVVAAHFAGQASSSSALTPTAMATAAAAIDSRVPNEAYVPVGQRIVEGLLAGVEGEGERDARLADFIRSWRRHFLEQGLRGQRAFLPPYWSVDFRVKNRPRPSRGARGQEGQEEEDAFELAN